MDAQNAVDAASTKPDASPKRPGPDRDTRDSQPKASIVKPTGAASLPPPVKDAKSTTAAANATDDDGGADGNSEAETVVLPGKDGYSPSKVRKVVNREDKDKADREKNGDSSSSSTRKVLGSGRGRDAGDKSHAATKQSSSTNAASSHRDGAAGEGASSAHVKKRPAADRPEKPRIKDGSSGLSSAPTSPPRHRPQKSLAAHTDSESETHRVRSPKQAGKPRSLLGDRPVLPHKRKAPKADSDDEADARKARRARTSGVGLDAEQPSKHRDRERDRERDRDRADKIKDKEKDKDKDRERDRERDRDNHKSAAASRSHHDANQGTRNRSASPAHPRTHRRSLSTQLPSHANGMSQKKKRVPAPLQSTDYHSDDSSGGGSPRVRSSKLRSLTTPATADSTNSPIKMAPHKKHLDAHGQTFLARACARGEYDTAKMRLAERPEDLNVADFAGNTPLQIASLNGYEDIVKLLIEAGCNLDCVNYDKDTPLLDAVDNGHVGVVRLLLDAGVNPRKANVNGEEPLDRISDDTDNAAEMRALLKDAKKRQGERRLTSEEHHREDEDGRFSHGPDSPRRSPPLGGAGGSASSRRLTTVRANKTSNHLLYMPMDDKTLRAAAGKGDEETVTRILQVRDSFDDPESMVAAARGGHETVMQLLLALGSAHPDPEPVPGFAEDVATPILAAIGQENISVIRLLLDQVNFNPTRRFQGKTYHEIARQRQGPNWKEEEQMLKDAFDAWRKSNKDTGKVKSPGRREQDREARRAGRTESRDDAPRVHKRKPSSPSREPKKTGANKAATTSPREKRRSDSFTSHQDEQPSPKRTVARSKKEDRASLAASTSEREPSPSSLKNAAKIKRGETDVALSSEGETVNKPRRKLVSGRDLKGDREKIRRASMASATPSVKEPTSPREARDSRHEDAPEKQKADKHLDRTKQLKRDESRDRLGVSGGEGSAKRHRSSATPPHLGSSEKDTSEGPAKKRRLDVDGKDKKLRLASSAEERSSKPGSTKEGSLKSKAGQKLREEDERKLSVSAKPKKRDVSRESSLKERARATPPIERNITVKTEDMDIDMPDADRSVADKETPARTSKPKEDEARKSKQADAEAAAASAAAAEAKKRAEVQKRKDDEEKRKREEEEEAKKHREEEDKRRKEEEQRKRAEEDERKRKEEEEAKKQQREEAEKRRLEEARKQREEEERKRQEEERKRKMEEEERQKQEEEERLRKEQLEREAAEEARRLREEELRKEQERRDRLQREELERRRLVREAEQRRIAEERRAKLPPLFQWLDICSNPKTPDVAKRFCLLLGFRYDTINTAAHGTDAGRELWLVNSQVALLLGEKDLSLGRYTAWQRIPAPKPTNQCVVRMQTDIIGLIGQDHRDFALQLPGYYPPQYHTTGKLRHDVRSKMRNEANEKFRQMDLFFIKASDVLFLVPTIPHLRDLRITVYPRELPQNMTQLTSQNYKSDPDVEKYRGFAPGPRHYVNGQFVGEDLPRKAATSKQPYPDYRVPRRGLIAVPRDDPDYARLCQEQGLSHLLSPAASSPVLPNGVHSSPSTAASPRSDVSGATTPSGLSKTGFAGHNETRSPGYSTNSVAGIKAHADGKPLVNGINHDGAVNGDGQH